LAYSVLQLIIVYGVGLFLKAGASFDLIAPDLPAETIVMTVMGLAWVACLQASIVPSIAIGTWRCHDFGKTGWLMLLA
jgi:uncharacterized membrane protein YhaH (DUF805 family)